MIQYFTNRELSQKLEINLARWKRWSRSFLPPDPLGGMQSGYARQYLFKDLFKVLLGGHLLSVLKLSVADSKQVLDDLSPWLKKNGFFDWNGSDADRANRAGKPIGCRIYLSPIKLNGSKKLTGFRYLVRRIMEVESADHSRVVETYVETPIHAEPSKGHDLFQDPELRVINVSALHGWAIRKLHPPRH